MRTQRFGTVASQPGSGTDERINTGTKDRAHPVGAESDDPNPPA